jgi:group I intron endonuclease
LPEIYKIINKINGKIYVGQTIRPLEKRKSRHLNDAKYGSKNPIHRAMRKYGVENFVFETIEKCDKIQLDDKEKFWIENLNTLCRNGYNVRNGNFGEQPEEWKIKVRKGSTGRGKSVLQFDPKTGNIIQEFTGLHDAGRSLGISYQNIYKCTKQYIEKTRHGFGFIYKDDYKKLIDKSELIIKGYRSSGKKGKAVYGIDDSGNKIEFYFITEAAKQVGCWDVEIRRSIKTGNKCKGYNWQYQKNEVTNGR